MKKILKKLNNGNMNKKKHGVLYLLLYSASVNCATDIPKIGAVRAFTRGPKR